MRLLPPMQTFHSARTRTRHGALVCLLAILGQLAAQPVHALQLRWERVAGSAGARGSGLPLDSHHPHDASSCTVCKTFVTFRDVAPAQASPVPAQGTCGMTAATDDGPAAAQAPERTASPSRAPPRIS